MASMYLETGCDPAMNQANRPTPAGPLLYAGPVTIEHVLNGFVARVGCKTVVFETQEKLLAELSRYFKNESAIQQEYLKAAEQKPA